jgi:large subunit ribosomal protein L4
MKLDVVKVGAKAGSKDVDVSAFGDKVLYRTLKDALVMFRANQRQGTVKTKGRSDVRGTNAKPWKQKHTGRARAGTRKSPIWRGGGVVFGPLPRDYSYHMPAKARRVALRGALYGVIEAGTLSLFDASGFTEPSAKTARAVLAGLGSPRRAVVVTSEPNHAVWKSFRNFPGVIVRPACDLCAFDVASTGVVLVEPAALEALAARVGAVPKAAAAAEGGDA